MGTGSGVEVPNLPSKVETPAPEPTPASDEGDDEYFEGGMDSRNDIDGIYDN
jgi:hypothetical protein